jgi:hypothetical protein
MKGPELRKKISEISDFFRDNDGLHGSLTAYGIDGAMLAFMSDQDIEDFFVKTCNLSKMSSAMLMAKIKSWS